MMIGTQGHDNDHWHSKREEREQGNKLNGNHMELAGMKTTESRGSHEGGTRNTNAKD
jgi:hypothetical protein